MMVVESELNWIKQQIRTIFPQAIAFAFGSRVKGTAKRFSDFDIAIDNHAVLDLVELSKLEEIFSNSDLVYKIDLVDWHRISPEFQQHIQQHCEPLLP